MDIHKWDKDDLWISENPFRQQMARHSSWEDFDQSNLDDLSVRIFANVEVFRFSFFNSQILSYSYLIFGASRNTQGASRTPRGSIWRQLESPGTIFEVFCDEVTFQEFTKSWNIIFSKFVRDKVRRNSEQSTPGRFPAIHLHPRSAMAMTYFWGFCDCRISGYQNSIFPENMFGNYVGDTSRNKS